MRLIDVDEIKLPRGFFEKVDNVPKFYEWLDTLPTVEAELIRHGRWLWVDGVRCSICNYKLQTTGLPSYCPHCGAKMEATK